MPPHAEHTAHHFLHHSIQNGFAFDPFSPKNGLGTFKNGVRKMSKMVTIKMAPKKNQNWAPKIHVGGAKKSPKWSPKNHPGTAKKNTRVRPKYSPGHRQKITRVPPKKSPGYRQKFTKIVDQNIEKVL